MGTLRLCTATEIAHVPELGILIALDAVLAMTVSTLELSLPDLDLARDRSLAPRAAVTHELYLPAQILEIIAELRQAIDHYRNLTLAHAPTPPA